MAGKLPKVTEYITNLGKSVGYASIETVKEPTSNMSDFLDTNMDLFKVIYSATKNYKATLKAADRAIKASKIYEAANLGIKALKEDLQTGKFYNKEREDTFGLQSMGDDFADFSDFESDDFSSLFDDNDDKPATREEPSTASVVAKTSAGLGDVINNASKSQSGVIVASAEALAETNRAGTRLLASQNEKLNATLVTGFAGVNAGMSMISAIMSGPMTTYMSESTKFYGDMSTKLSETNAYLKEMTEMQRNLYKVQEQEWKSTKYDEVVNPSGMPDLTAYAKRIYKNILDFDPTGGMLSGDKDENLFKMFVGSPMKAIPMMIAKMIIPTTVTKTLQAFDENMSGLFSSFISRMNTWAEDDASDGLNIKGIIGSILGIKIDKKTTVDTGKYKRGPMPFDGETKKAIVDVIPAYLARIESALTGGPERLYDGRSGKFKTVKDIHKEYKDMQESVYLETVSDIYDSYNKWANQYADTKEDRKALKEKYKKLGRRVYKDGGDFRPYAGYGPAGERRLETNPYTYGDVGFSDEEWLSLMRYLEKNDKKGIYSLSKNAINAAQRNTRNLQGNEGGFGNVFAALFDGRYQVVDEKGKLVNLDPNKTGHLYDKGPKKYLNNNDYLKDILAEVRYIRMSLGSGGKRGKRNGKNIGPNIPSFDTYYEDNFSEDEYVAEDNEFKNFEKQKAEESTAKKYGITKENIIKEFSAAQTLSEKWAVMKKGVDKLLRKPAEMITGIIRKADERVYSVMFGNEDGETFRDKHGHPYQGFLDYIIGRAGKMFDDFKDYMKRGFKTMWDKFKETEIGGKIANTANNIKRDVGQKLRNKAYRFRLRAGQAYENTYGRLFESMRQGKIVDASTVHSARLARSVGLTPQEAGTDTYDNEEMTDLLQQMNDAQLSAYGRVANKYGLTMISPGEIIIPNGDEKTRRRNLSGEKKEKSRILQALKGGRIAHNANGTQTASKNPETDKLMGAVKKVMGEIGGQGGDIAADALIGSGVSLVTGLFGGPLLGAAAGAGFGIVKNSKTAQRFLFGEVDETTGERKGAIVPKSVQDFFKKHSEGMIDFGLAGAVAGLFTPLGLVGGALAGATLGYAKNTKWFQDTMFGNEAEGKQGLISKETRDKIEKALPNIGIGAAAGALLGPMGLVGNLMLGATAGYVTSTNKFKEILMGKEGEDGKKHGGIAGAFKAGLVDPILQMGKEIATDLKDYAKKWIIEPTKDFVRGTGQFLKNTITHIGDRVADGINGIFQKHVGIPLEEWMREKVFKRLASVVGVFTKIPLTIGKAVVAAPFQALGYIGNSFTMAQVHRGSATNMTAKERIEFRKKHGLMDKIGKDNALQMDEALAGADLDTLTQMGDNLSTFIKGRGAKTKVFNDKFTEAERGVSGYFDDNGIWKKLGHGLGPNNATWVKKDIMRAIKKGDVEGVRRIADMNGLNADELLGSFDMEGLAAAKEESDNELSVSKEAMKKLAEQTGNTKLKQGLLKRKGTWHTKNLLRQIESEKSIKAAAATKQEEQKVYDESPEGKYNKEMNDRAKKIVDVLVSINNNIANMRGVRNANILSSDGTPENNGDEEPVAEIVPVPEVGGSMKYDKDGNVINDKETNDTQRKMSLKEKVQNKIAHGLSTFGDFLGGITGKNKDDDEPKKSLISRILGGLGGISSGLGSGAGSILGAAGRGLGTAGTVLGGVISIALLGWGSEFLRKDVAPWFKEHVAPLFAGISEKIVNSELFQTIKGYTVKLVDGIESGALLATITTKTVQGLGFTLKNIVGPLAEALVTALPEIGASIVGGIGKGMWNLLKNGAENVVSFGSRSSAKVDVTSKLNKAYSSMPVGSYESEIAKEYTGSEWKASSASSSIDMDKVVNVKYSSGISSSGTALTTSGVSSEAIDNGATTEVDEDGVATVYNKNGKYVGSYDATSGQIIDATVNKSNPSWIRSGATNAFKRSLATGKTPAMLRGLNKVTGKFTAKKILKQGATGGLLGGVSAMTKGITKAGTSVANATSNIGLRLNTLLGNKTIARGADMLSSDLRYAAADAVKSGADEGASKLTKAVANAVDSNSGFISNLAEKISAFGAKLASSKVLGPMVSFLSKGFTKAADGKVLGPLIKELFEKIGQKAASNIAGKAAKKAAEIGLKAVAGLTPITIAFWVKSFSDGAILKTETILGITKDSGVDLGIGARFVAGLIHAINENLLLGLIDTGWLFEQATKVFGSVLGVSTEELKEAQAKTDEILAAAGLESGDVVTLEEYNDQESIRKKGWKWLVNFNNKLNESGDAKIAAASQNKTSSSSTSGSGRSGYSGKGRGGSQGGMYAAMKYGNSTIGEAGCAPVAASSVMGSRVPEAAAFAQATGHVSADGSTDIGFFNDYFSAKGIPNSMTTNKSSVENAIKNGNQAVLLGRDTANGAYSNNDHFITAKGMDRSGNVIVDDPALGMRKLRKGQVLNNMKASVITGRGRSHLRGKGIDLNSTGQANAQQVVEVARSQKGTTEGANNSVKYNDDYNAKYSGNANDPWCCKFVWWVFEHAGASQLFFGGGGTASCTILMNYYKRSGQIVDVKNTKPGDIVFFNFDKENRNVNVAKHVGIATGSSINTVTTIEGNTSPSTTSGSQTNGDGVYEKDRSRQWVVAVARPAYNDAVLGETYGIDEDGNTTESTGFFGALANVGKSLVKALFGEDLYNAVFGEDTSSSSSSTDYSTSDLEGANNAEKIWHYLRNKGYSEEGTAAIMGNLAAESALNPGNLENSVNSSLNITDEAYTEAVNSKTRSRDQFIADAGGYGLAQWTRSRRERLYDNTIGKNKQINDIAGQLDLLDSEVNQYGLQYRMQNAKDISEANKTFIQGFEKFSGYENENHSEYGKRLNLGKQYYDELKGTARSDTPQYLNNYPTTATTNTSSSSNNYSAFLQTIVSILMSISGNTEALTKILDILSTNFNINVDTSEVQKTTNTAKQQAREALNRLMADKSNAEDVMNIMQSKNTEWLIETMTQIAQE